MGCSSTKPSQTESDVPHVFKARYRTGDVLGEGAYSVVKAATSRSNGEKVAVKIVTRSDLSQEDEAALRQEVDILKSIQHPNIIRCMDFFEEVNTYYVVLEFMEGGELFDRIVKKTSYNEKEARDVVRILINAIKYCHDKDIVHRDLKPENLLMKSKNDDAELKIADFGFAISAKDDSLSTQCGTPTYIAPEILEGKAYGKAVDMWSIGVISYILLGGYPPFHDNNLRQLFSKIKKGNVEFHTDYWSHVSESAKDLIKGLLNVNPQQRLTAEKALLHPWLITEDKILAAINLDTNLAEFKKFNAARKFKAATKAVMAINKMKKLASNSKKELQTTEGEDNTRI